jgi:hypothetical protein
MGINLWSEWAGRRIADTKQANKLMVDGVAAS